ASPSHRLVGWASGRTRVLEAVQQGGLLLGFVALLAYFSASSDRFLTGSNISVLLQQTSVTALIAVPGAMLVLAGYVDLSVGAVAGFSAVTFGQLDGQAGLGWAIAAAIGVSALWGLLNGVLIAGYGCSPIIVTLGGWTGIAGLDALIENGNSQIGFGATFDFLGNGTLLGVPAPVVVMILAFIL